MNTVSANMYQYSQNCNSGIKFCAKPSTETKEFQLSDSADKIKVDRFGESVSGQIYDTKFDLRHSGFLRDRLSGKINEKPLNLAVKNDFFGNQKLSGMLGDENIDLVRKAHVLGNYSIKGNFKDEEIDLKLSPMIDGWQVNGEKTDLRAISTENKDELVFEGEYGEDNEFAPILADIINNLE